MPVGVKQHLMGLKKVSPHEESRGVRQLDMGHMARLVRSPPKTAKSSLQSNWNASPGRKVRGTKVPRPVVWLVRCRSARPFAGKLIPRINF